MCDPTDGVRRMVPLAIHGYTESQTVVLSEVDLLPFLRRWWVYIGPRQGRGRGRR